MDVYRKIKYWNLCLIVYEWLISTWNSEKGGEGLGNSFVMLLRGETQWICMTYNDWTLRVENYDTGPTEYKMIKRDSPPLKIATLERVFLISLVVL